MPFGYVAFKLCWNPLAAFHQLRRFIVLDYKNNLNEYNRGTVDRSQIFKGKHTYILVISSEELHHFIWSVCIFFYKLFKCIKSQVGRVSLRLKSSALKFSQVILFVC